MPSLFLNRAEALFDRVMSLFLGRHYNRLRQVVKYGVIGASCAGLDYVVFLVLRYFLAKELTVSPLEVFVRSAHFGEYVIRADSELILTLLTNAVSVHCGIFASFVLNRHFTFKVKDLTVHRFASFYLVGIAGLLLSSILLVIFVDGLDFEAHLAKAFTIVFVALAQFLLNKFVSFKHQ